MHEIVNTSNGFIVARRAKVARSFWRRLVGLMFRQSMGEDEALILYRSSCIHTFFMRFPIDLLFLDGDLKVLKICHTLRPWRFAVCCGASVVMELPSGKAIRVPVEIGDVLEPVSASDHA
jgi:uncharacterized membrane protein (UPF0127 family)